MFKHACGIGLEGVVSKVRDSRYNSGRGNDWVKKTCAQRETLRIAYVAETGVPTERAIWPIAMAFYERRQTVAAWCELRSAFRHFRTDRITALTVTGERYPRRRAELVKAWRREMNFSE